MRHIHTHNTQEECVISTRGKGVGSVPAYFVLNMYCLGNWLFGLRHPSAGTYRRLGSTESWYWRSEMLVTSWAVSTSLGAPRDVCHQCLHTWRGEPHHYPRLSGGSPRPADLCPSKGIFSLKKSSRC